MRAKLKEVKAELRRRMHLPVPEQGSWLAQVVRGFFAYHAVPTNFAAPGRFRHRNYPALAANAPAAEPEG